MARRKRFEARRAKREDAAEQAFQMLVRKARKEDLAIARDYFRQRKVDEWSSRLFGLHRRAEVRILEGKMRAVRSTRITFWSKEAILNDPHKRSLIARQKARRKR